MPAPSERLAGDRMPRGEHLQDRERVGERDRAGELRGGQVAGEQRLAQRRFQPQCAVPKKRSSTATCTTRRAMAKRYARSFARQRGGHLEVAHGPGGRRALTASPRC